MTTHGIAPTPRVTRRQRMILATLARGGRLEPVSGSQGAAWQVQPTGARIRRASVAALGRRGFVSLTGILTEGTATLTEKGRAVIARKPRAPYRKSPARAAEVAP